MSLIDGVIRVRFPFPFSLPFLLNTQQAVKLQIWDTAGQDRFRTVNPAFYRGANGIVLVYDVTNKESYDRIEGWMSEAVQYASEDSKKLLVGNKADLEPRQVPAYRHGRTHLLAHSLMPPPAHSP
jgi:small GTP-binding protein